MARILVVEDEAPLRSSIRQSLELDGHVGSEASCLRDAFELLGREEFDAIVTDLNLVGESGLELIRRARGEGFEGLIVVVTAYGTVETAIEALKSGADEFIQKPLRLDELSVVVARGLEHRRLKGQLDLHQRIQRVASEAGEVFGTSAAWQRTLGLAARFASLPVPTAGEKSEPPTILLLGETGSGKGVIARHIHASDPSAASGVSRPFVHVNCAALPPNLIEAELFGHEKGAFTDAKSARPGLFELAEGGTIFLDEIGEMALDMQAKLLLVVERGVFRRIGGSKECRVRARIVAATNQNLEERSRSGGFRADLLFRLDALTVRIPPLREREGDALIIAQSMLGQFARQYGREGLQLSPAAKELILSYTWPGNTRQLLNAIRRAAILCDERVIEPDHLGLHSMPVGASPAPTHVSAAVNGHMPSDSAGLLYDFAKGPVTFEQVERTLILEAVRHAQGNVSLAAKMIGLNRGALRYRIERLGLEDQVREIHSR